MASDLSDRGVGFQAFGFAVVGFSSVALLHIFSDSNFWLYKSFQTAVTQSALGILGSVGGAVRLGEEDV